MVPPVSTKRQSPPKDFALRIESFSKLAAASTGNNAKYESIVFSAEGYSWRLQLYPNGNTKANGSDHISLYLSITHFPSYEDVFVEFKFFIFDQINNDYLTIHDGTVKRFHRMKKEWGYDQLIESKVFNDPGLGYVVNDCCEIGVEILKVPYYTTVRRQTIQMVQPSSPFQMTISEFSKLRSGPNYVDPPITFAEQTWKLKVYPNGYGNQVGNSLSLFLELVDAAKLPLGQQVWAEFILRVIDQRQDNHIEKTVKGWFSSTSPKELGFADFMPRGDLYQARKGFVMNDEIIFEVEFIDVSVTNNFTS